VATKKGGQFLRDGPIHQACGDFDHHLVLNVGMHAGIPNVTTRPAGPGRLAHARQTKVRHHNLLFSRFDEMSGAASWNKSPLLNSALLGHLSIQ
jgi:hypothetical protein